MREHTNLLYMASSLKETKSKTSPLKNELFLSSRALHLVKNNGEARGGGIWGGCAAFIAFN